MRSFFSLVCVYSLLTAAAFVFAMGMASAFPTPRDEPKAKEVKKAKPKIPDVAMSSNWGQVTQEGRTITIAGHPSWFALGGIRDDGKVELVWTKAIDGHPCPGVYEWDGEKLVGQWGYAPDTYVENGELKGFTLSDTIRAVKPVVPDL